MASHNYLNVIHNNSRFYPLEQYIQFSTFIKRLFKTPSMRNSSIFLATISGFLLLSCGQEPKKEKGGPEIKVNTTTEQPVTTEVKVPVDMNNKGIGPISSYEFSEEINQEMAAAGELLFTEKLCSSCHAANQRGIGPALAGVYDKRSPEWVLNMILNPMEMIEKDPIAVALREEYGGAIMAPAALTDQEAKELAEYLRTL